MKLLTRMINFLPHDAWQKIGIGVIISCTLILEICSYNNLHYYSNWHAITVEIVWIVICLCIAIWPRKASFIVATEPKHFNHHSKHLLTSKFQNKISYIV